MGLLNAIFGSNSYFTETERREVPESEVPEWVKKGLNNTKNDSIGFDKGTTTILNFPTTKMKPIP